MSDSNSKLDDEKLDEYVLQSLKNSHEYNRHIEQKGEVTINYFLVFITAIIGIVIVLLSSEKVTLVQKYISISTGSLFIGSIGVIVSFWEFSFITTRMIEGLFEIIPHLYFREKNPNKFDKFGFSKLLTVFRIKDDPKELPLIFRLSWVSVHLIGGFSSLMFGIGWWSFYKIIAEINGEDFIEPNISPLLQGVILTLLIFVVIFTYGQLVPKRIIRRFKKDLLSITQELE